MPALEEIENLIETGRHDEAAAACSNRSSRPGRRHWRGGSSAARPRRGQRGDSQRPGYLVINPLGVPRRAAVDLARRGRSTCVPRARCGPPSSPTKASGRSSTCRRSASRGSRREADRAAPPAASAGLSARGRQLRNESIEIEIDAATGGLRSVAAAGENDGPARAATRHRRA